MSVLLAAILSSIFSVPAKKYLFGANDSFLKTPPKNSCPHGYLEHSGRGKYDIRNGLVTGLASDSDTLNMTIFDFEKKIFNVVSQPGSIGIENATTQNAEYTNDTDLKALQ